MVDLGFLGELAALLNENVLEKVQMILLLISLVLALMQCYFGYRFLRFWIGVVGFFLGFILSAVVSLRFFEFRSWYPWAIGLAGGAVFALISYKLYLVGVFIFSGLIAAGGVYSVLELPAVYDYLDGLQGESLHMIIVLALCAAAFILVGVLSVKFSKPFIIVVTSISGGLLAARTLVQLIPSITEHPLYQFYAAAALAGSGILLQHLMNLGKK